MATQTRAPTSDLEATGTWTGSAGTRYTLVDDHPDSTGADKLTHGTTAGRIRFGFSAFTVPTGSTINSVQVVYYDEKTGGPSADLAGEIRVNGTNYAATGHNPSNGSWVLRTETWTTNPNTGAAWTVADVNGTGSNPLQSFGVVSADASPTVELSSIQIVVDYTIPSQTITPQALASGAALGQPTVIPGTATVLPQAFQTGSIGQPTVLSSAFDRDAFDNDAFLILYSGTAAQDIFPQAFQTGAIGQPTVTWQQFITPQAFTSGGGLGQPSFSTTVTILPQAFTAGGGLGQPTVSATVTIAPQAFTAGGAIGQPTIAATVTIGPQGFSTTAIGQPTLVQDNNTVVYPEGLASSAALGQPTVTWQQFISPQAFLSGSALGQPTITWQQFITPQAFTAGGALGQPTLVPGVVTVGPQGFLSGSAIGQPTLAATVTILPQAFTAGGDVGQPTLSATVTITPQGFASGSIGQPSFATTVTILPQAFTAGGAIGQPTLSATVTITPQAFTSGGAIGQPTLTSVYTITPQGFLSGSAIGQPTVTWQQFITPQGFTRTTFGSLLIRVKTETRYNPVPYTVGVPPSGIDPAVMRYLGQELRKIEAAHRSLREGVPQVLQTAPARPQVGTLYRAVAPWDPLLTGNDEWVWWDGTQWVLAF